jgi:hypothetical protein
LACLPSAAPKSNSSATSAITLAQANLIVAKLGGFWGRKGDGHPGAESLGRGLEVLGVLVHYCELIAPAPKPHRHPPKRSRKPG